MSSLALLASVSENSSIAIVAANLESHQILEIILPCLQLSHLLQRRSLRLSTSLAPVLHPPIQHSLPPRTHQARPKEDPPQPLLGRHRPMLQSCLAKARQSRRLPRMASVLPIRMLFQLCLFFLHLSTFHSSICYHHQHVAATNVPSYSCSQHAQTTAWPAQDHSEEGATFFARSTCYLEAQAAKAGPVLEYVPEPSCDDITAVSTVDGKRKWRARHG